MRKKILSFGDLELTIAELNTAQVEELIDFHPHEDQDTSEQWKNEQWKRRQWRTILLALNNAQATPTKDRPLGSDTEPQSRADLEPVLGYASVNELHREVLALSGLRSAASGESKAAVDRPSISGTSTAA